MFSLAHASLFASHLPRCVVRLFILRVHIGFASCQHYCCHANRRKVTRDDAAAIVFLLFLLYAFRDVKKAAYCKTVWAGKKDMHFLIPFRVWGRAERRGRTLLLRGVGFLPFTLMLIRHMSIRWVYCFPLPTGPGRFFHSRGVHFARLIPFSLISK